MNDINSANNFQPGDYVKNPSGLIGQIVTVGNNKAVEYPSGFKIFLSNDIANTLTKIDPPET